MRVLLCFLYPMGHSDVHGTTLWHRNAIESSLFQQWLKNIQTETGILANGDMSLNQVLIQVSFLPIMIVSVILSSSWYLAFIATLKIICCSFIIKILFYTSKS